MIVQPDYTPAEAIIVRVWQAARTRHLWSMSPEEWTAAAHEYMDLMHEARESGKIGLAIELSEAAYFAIGRREWEKWIAELYDGRPAPEIVRLDALAQAAWDLAELLDDENLPEPTRAAAYAEARRLVTTALRGGGEIQRIFRNLAGGSWVLHDLTEEVLHEMEAEEPEPA